MPTNDDKSKIIEIPELRRQEPFYTNSETGEKHQCELTKMNHYCLQNQDEKKSD